MIANIQIVIAGAAAGSLIGLLASGLMIQHRSSGVLNFGHGAVAALSAYIYVHLAGVWGWPPLAAALAGILAGGLVTSVFQVLVIRPLHGASVLAKTVASLGLMLSVGAIIVLMFGHDIQSSRPLFRSSRLTVPLGDSMLSIGTDRLVLVVASMGICILLWALFKFSAFGRATRAVADNRRAAELLGYSSLRMEWLNWTLGGLMAGVAGVLISTISPPNVSSYTAALLGALSVALLAQFRSFAVLLTGGIGVGAVQALLQRYGGELQMLTGLTGWSDMVPLAIILVAVLGSGQTIAAKGLVKDEPLPDAPVVRRLGLGVVVCLLAGAAWIALVPATWVDPTTGTLIRFILALSLVVLTGYAGQISLGQMTIAGIGAFAAAKAATNLGVPFPFPVAFGGLAALGVAAIFGAPALRTRGLNLAVVTLGLATVVEVAFFANRELGGGDQGQLMPAAEFLGISLNSVTDPRKFAVAVLLCAVAAGAAVALLRRSGLGQRLLAIRANERGAAATGISLMSTKLLAFMIAGGLAGIAGALEGYRSMQISWAVFEPHVSIALVLAAVLGGISTISGAVVAGLLMAGGLIPTLLSFDANTQDWINLLFGTGAIVTVLLNQSGIGPDVMHAIKAIERRIGFATTVMPGAPDGRPGPAAQPKLPAIGHPEGARLVVDGLTVDFGGVVAVKDLSLSIAPGTIHGLIGPNGAGKSTVVDAISGFQKPTSGSVTFGGVALDALPAHRRVQAGICRTFQNLELYEELTVAENLETAREAARRSDREWVEAVVDFVGLRDVLSVRVRDLPHGRRRLVGVARALATKPWLLILDEPAAGLDTEETTRFADLVRGIADCGVTILLIEHDMGLVMGVCNRITVLAAGSLMIEDVPAVVVADEKVRRTYLGEELASAGSA